MPDRIESVTDFSHRSVHVASVLGKKIATTYYGALPHHSYYNGCSAGGRQGLSVASRYPGDFDGIIAGTPAVDWNRFIGAPALWAGNVAVNTSREIPLTVWNTTITQEILKQCDGLDGKIDGIIADPTLCKWNPETLLCGPGSDVTTCLTQDQVDGLKEFYAPILGTDGEYMLPGYEPGSEADTTLGFPLNGVVSQLTIVSQPLLDQSNRLTHPSFHSRRAGTTMRFMAIPRALSTSRSLI